MTVAEAIGDRREGGRYHFGGSHIALEDQMILAERNGEIGGARRIDLDRRDTRAECCVGIDDCPPPMPALPPVTSATFPSSRMDGVMFMR